MGGEGGRCVYGGEEPEGAARHAGGHDAGGRSAGARARAFPGNQGSTPTTHDGTVAAGQLASPANSSDSSAGAGTAAAKHSPSGVSALSNGRSTNRFATGQDIGSAARSRGYLRYAGGAIDRKPDLPCNTVDRGAHRGRNPLGGTRARNHPATSLPADWRDRRQGHIRHGGEDAAQR